MGRLLGGAATNFRRILFPALGRSTRNASTGVRSRIFGLNNDPSSGQFGDTSPQSTINEAASLLGAVSELLKKVTSGGDAKKGS